MWLLGLVKNHYKNISFCLVYHRFYHFSSTMILFLFLSSSSQLFLFFSIFPSLSILLPLFLLLLSSLSQLFLDFPTSFFHFFFTLVIFLPFLSFFYPDLFIDFLCLSPLYRAFLTLCTLSLSLLLFLSFFVTHFNSFISFPYYIFFLFWILDFSPFSFVFLHLYHSCLHFVHHLPIFTNFLLLYPILQHFSTLLLS